MNQNKAVSTESELATAESDKQLKKLEHQRGTIAEWTVTVLLLLFGTTTLVQAFVIPTGSMENNLLVGDHLLVDKLAYAPPGPISKHLLPYQDIKRGDIVVFRYPVDIKQTFVKRVIGVPGDRIRLENKQLIRNGERVHGALQGPQDRVRRQLSRQLPEHSVPSGERRRHRDAGKARRRTAR